MLKYLNCCADKSQLKQPGLLIFLVVLLVVGLGGCGNKGDLYMPQKPPQELPKDESEAGSEEEPEVSSTTSTEND